MGHSDPLVGVPWLARLDERQAPLQHLVTAGTCPRTSGPSSLGTFVNFEVFESLKAVKNITDLELL